MRDLHQHIESFIRSWVAETMRDLGITDMQEFVQQGYCADLAMFIWESLTPEEQQQVEWCDCEAPCHTWIRYNGRHYDMLDPQGAPSQTEMKEFARLTRDDLLEQIKWLNKYGGVNIEVSRNSTIEELRIALGWQN